MSDLCVMLVAAEPSGDELGAALARAIRQRRDGPVRFVGVGGPAMAREGVESAFDPYEMAVVGALNVLAKWPLVRTRAKDAAALAARERPDVAVLIDAWGFSIRVAGCLRRLDASLPIVKYVAPQVWATRPGRARTLARAVDRLLTIHAFDAPYFEREGLKTTFVGNPTLQRDFSAANPSGLRGELGLAARDPLLLVLPGSRLAEVRRLMGPFGDAASRLSLERSRLKVVVAAAAAVAREVRARAELWPVQPIIIEGDDRRLAAMRAATVALACSGTVTTELAMAGCPMIVAYRLDSVTHGFAKLLLRTPYVTLINVAAGRFVVPERIQGECRPEVLAGDLRALLDDPGRRAAQVAAQTAALQIMGAGIADPIGAAAEAVLEVAAEGRTRCRP